MAELSLPVAPVYRRFLAGGAEPLRLSLPGALLVAAGGLTLLGIGRAASALGGTAGLAIAWPSVAAATLCAWMVAALAARWLGSRLGVLAGCVFLMAWAQLTGIYLLLPSPGAAAAILFCTAIAAAMGTFALANVPGRLPLVDRRWTRWGFYAAAGASLVVGGPVGPAFILSGCLLFLILCADSRGARFFASPVGIGIFVLMAAVRLAGPWGIAGEALDPGTSPGGVPSWLAGAGLPWTLLVVLTVAVGLRQGHYATPIWRFFGCWVVGPLALTAVGGFRSPAELGALLPPLAVIAAAGLWSLLAWCRRWWPRAGGRRFGGRRAGDR